MSKPYFKIICVDESDPFEFQVLEDVNRGTIDEVHEFVKEKLSEVVDYVRDNYDLDEIVRI